MNNPVNLLHLSGSVKIKPILQTEAAECGLACVAMIATFHGYKVDINTLRREYPVSLKGSSLKGLIDTAAGLNMAARPLRLELEHLPKLKLPCILHWDMNHYVVLRQVAAKGIVVIDPGFGERVYPIKEVDKHFTGVALELTPVRGFEKKTAERTLGLGELWGRVTGLTSSLAQILVLSLLIQIFAIASPFFMQIVVDDVVVSRDFDLLTILAIGFFLLMMVNVAVVALRTWTVILVGTQMNIQIATNLFRHLIRLPLDWFEKRHVGDVVSRFGSLDRVNELLTTGVVEVLVDGVMVIGTLAIMFMYNINLALIVLTAFVLYGLSRWILYWPLRRLSEESIIAKAKEDSGFMEAVRAAQTVKLFGKENQRQAVWQNLYANSINADIRLGKLDIGYKALNGILLGAENILVIYLAAKSVMANEMSIGMLYAFMSYKQNFTGKAGSLVDKFIQFRMLELHLSRIGDIALTATEADIGATTSARDLKGSLEIRGLSYRYAAGDPDVVKDANLKISAGESVCLVGSSGCGKSTLLKLMLGLLKPQSGGVFMDGIDIAKLGNGAYRDQVAAVMQNDQLLSGSVGDNICFFDPGFSQEKIEHSARLAGIHEEIMAMPMGYNSLIGDMGSTLSGGQKQRVILARALYKEPKILFLDEATSHLDVALEGYINENVKRLEMTRIIIAHRPETIRSADKVFIVEAGRINPVISTTPVNSRATCSSDS